MSQASRIIAKFGGIRPMARALKHKHATRVQGWQSRGRISAKAQPAVLAAARELGIPLTPADFFDLDDDAAEAAQLVAAAE